MAVLPGVLCHHRQAELEWLISDRIKIVQTEHGCVFNTLWGVGWGGGLNVKQN